MLKNSAYTLLLLSLVEAQPWLEPSLWVVEEPEVLYQSGEVRTFESFKYGKFRAKIKAPNKKGTCTSFFTFFEGPKWAPEKWNEIDFDIVPTVEGTPISTNIIFGDGEVLSAGRVNSTCGRQAMSPLQETNVSSR